jgi:hypothetical protein
MTTPEDSQRSYAASREERLAEAYGAFPFRRFELTIGVYVPRDAPIPETFNDWIERAGFECNIASPTTLERVVETRYPMSADVIEKRGERSDGPWR